MQFSFCNRRVKVTKKKLIAVTINVVFVVSSQSTIQVEKRNLLNQSRSVIYYELANQSASNSVATNDKSGFSQFIESVWNWPRLLSDSEGSEVMAASGSKRWYFSEEKIMNSPSRRHNISADKEESYRQQAANFIQDMGQRLQV